MKYGRSSYLFQPTVEMWNDMVATWPRENLERVMFTLAYNTGVLAGLEVKQLLTPTMQVRITLGVAVFRDATTQRAKVIQVDNETTLDLTSNRPLAGVNTVLICASPKVVTSLSTQVVPPPQTLSDGTLMEDYDAAAVTYSFDRLELDSYELHVRGTPQNDDVVLAQVSLTSAMTQVLNSNISNEPRQLGSPKEVIAALQARVTTLEQTQSPIGSVTEWFGDSSSIPNGWMAADGRKLLQSAYPKLYSLLGLRYSTVGVGNPNTDVSEGEFRIPRLTDRVSVAAGAAYALGQQGGNAETTLGIANLPAHDHAITVSGVADHSHSASIAEAGAHRHNFIGSYGGNANSDNPIMGDVTGAFKSPDNAGMGVQEAGSHSHSISIGNAGGHSHGAAASSVGSGQPFSNMPPFFGALKILRAI